MEWSDSVREWSISSSGEEKAGRKVEAISHGSECSHNKMVVSVAPVGSWRDQCEMQTSTRGGDEDGLGDRLYTTRDGDDSHRISFNAFPGLLPEVGSSNDTCSISSC